MAYLDLVRSMRRSLPFAMLLASCTSPQPQPGPIAIVGPYKNRLSTSDIEQIRFVVLKYSRQPLREVNVVRRHTVRVQTGSQSNWTRFTLVQRDNRWMLDETVPMTAEVERTIITY